MISSTDGPVEFEVSIGGWSGNKTKTFLNIVGLSKAPSTLRRRNLKTVVSLCKLIKCFSCTLHRRNSTRQQLPVILDLSLRKNLSEKTHNYLDAIVFEKHRRNVFHPHENGKSVFSNSTLKSVFEKLRFRDG